MSTQPPAGAVEKTKQRVEVTTTDFNDPVAIYLNTGMFDQLQRVARMMAQSTYIPEHLRAGKDKDGKERSVELATGDCFLVVAQAFRWGMDPFLVAQHTYPVRGKLGYEGKIIAALVNVRAEKPLSFVYSGEKGTQSRTVTVTAQRRGDPDPVSIDGSIKEWATDNPKWKSMADQMLAYRGSREWARRYMPEAVLGIADVDVEDPPPARIVDITPDPLTPARGLEPLKEKLRAEKAEAGPSVPTPVQHSGKPVDAPAFALGAQPNEEQLAAQSRAAALRLARDGVGALLEQHPADAADAEKEPPVVVPPGKLKDGRVCLHEALRGARLGTSKKFIACPEQGCDAELTQAQCDALGPV